MLKSSFLIWPQRKKKEVIFQVINEAQMFTKLDVKHLNPLGQEESKGLPLKFLTVPFLGFPQYSRSSCCQHSLGYPCVCVYVNCECLCASEEFLGTRKDNNAEQLRSLVWGCCLLFSWTFHQTSCPPPPPHSFHSHGVSFPPHSVSCNICTKSLEATQPMKTFVSH